MSEETKAKGSNMIVNKHASSRLDSLTRWLGWIVLGLCVFLCIWGGGYITLTLLNRRYRDLAVFWAESAFTIICFVLPLYLAVRCRLRRFRWRAVLCLILSAVVSVGWFFILNAPSGRDYRYYETGPRLEKEVVFLREEIPVYYIQVYEYENLLWTGPKIYEYSTTS